MIARVEKWTSWAGPRLRCHYSKNKSYQFVVSSNKYVAAASLISLHGESNEDSEKQYIVSNIESESVIPSIKKNLFHQRMIYFVNELELSG